MTERHYEILYEGAVYLLSEMLGKQVGEVAHTHDGVRYRDIDGRPATDDALFELAWGRETADHIRDHRPAR
jgi:hypothetical protein